MTAAIDLQKAQDTVSLGGTLLPVTEYQIKAEVPVLRRTLCDGTHSITLLSSLPCTFTFSGQLLREDASRVNAGLQADMRAHMPFSFEFAGFQFSDMQVISAECSVRQAAHTAAVTVSMTGVLQK